MSTCRFRKKFRRNDMELNSVGKRIKWAREAAGLTQSELGARLGTDQSAVSKWESDEITPRGSTRLRIGNALCVSYEWLRSGEGPVVAPEPTTQAEINATAEAINEADANGEGISESLSFASRFITMFDLKLSDRGGMVIALYFGKMWQSLNAKNIKDIPPANIGLFIKGMLEKVYSGIIK